VQASLRAIGQKQGRGIGRSARRGCGARRNALGAQGGAGEDHKLGSHQAWWEGTEECRPDVPGSAPSTLASRCLQKEASIRDALSLPLKGGAETGLAWTSLQDAAVLQFLDAG